MNMQVIKPVTWDELKAQEQADIRQFLEKYRTRKLMKAGLAGDYLTADCALGKKLFELAKDGTSAYLWGRPGRGKTYAASCALRLWMHDWGYGFNDGTTGLNPKPFPGKIWNVSELLDAVKDGFKSKSSNPIEFASNVPLLVLDELGGEVPSPWSAEQITQLLDARYRSGLPTIITSNYSISGVATRWETYAGDRFVSRLLPWYREEVTGPDRRAQENVA